MQPYELTLSAHEDLKEIVRYTLTKWGKKQSLHYAGLLEKPFRKIAERTACSRTFSNRCPHALLSCAN